MKKKMKSMMSGNGSGIPSEGKLYLLINLMSGLCQDLAYMARLYYSFRFSYHEAAVMVAWL